SGADKDELGRWASRYALRLLESAGLEVVFDGEQQRSEMYAWAVDHSDGFAPRGTVRSFDNKYYSKSAVVSEPSPREPYHNDELDIFVESFNESVEGLDCFFSTHLCFSDYDLFFPAIEQMHGCKQFCVGFANYDTRELGTSGSDRPGYEVISKFRDLPYEPILGLGVLDIHTDFDEPPELVRDRILYEGDVFGEP